MKIKQINELKEEIFNIVDEIKITEDKNIRKILIEKLRIKLKKFMKEIQYLKTCYKCNEYLNEDEFGVQQILAYSCNNVKIYYNIISCNSCGYMNIINTSRDGSCKYCNECKLKSNLIDILEIKEKQPLELHNESTINWSSGYRKAIREILDYIKF